MSELFEHCWHDNKNEKTVFGIRHLRCCYCGVLGKRETRLVRGASTEHGPFQPAEDWVTTLDIDGGIATCDRRIPVVGVDSQQPGSDNQT